MVDVIEYLKSINFEQFNHIVHLFELIVLKKYDDFYELIYKNTNYNSFDKNKIRLYINSYIYENKFENKLFQNIISLLFDLNSKFRLTINKDILEHIYNFEENDSLKNSIFEISKNYELINIFGYKIYRLKLLYELLED